MSQSASQSARESSGTSPASATARLEVTHRLVDVPGGRIHVAEQGSGPLVLLVHGFPESWYSWRHQIPALAEAGYRVAAIDVRGYGRSSKPQAVEAYGMLAHVADNVAVVRALGEETATIVGHDWGSPIAANSALLRPDVFTAVGMLSIPYAPPGGRRKPTESFAGLNALAGEGQQFYMTYMQEPGRAEADIERDVRGWLAGIYAGLSADTMRTPGDQSVYFVPEGGMLADRPAEQELPSWLSEADLDFYAGEFERTGLSGAVNRYRNIDRDWEDLAAWHGEPIRQPSLFIAGDHDAWIAWTEKSIAAFPRTLPGLVGSHVFEGCGHWVQQERAEDVNRLLVDWLRGLD